jgi:WD40 repeat protein
VVIAFILWLDDTSAIAENPTPLPAFQKSGCDALAFSPDGKLLATGGVEGTVIIWSVAERKDLAILTGDYGVVLSLTFSPDGKRLAGGTSEKMVQIWDTTTWKTQDVIKGPDSYCAVCYSPDGKFLATAEYGGGIVRLWDANSMLKRVRFDGHTAAVVCLAFSPDGKYLASGGDKGQVKIWDLQTCKETADLKGHKTKVKGLAFSPDNKMLATVGQERTIKLWDFAKGKELRSLVADSNAQLQAVQFSPDGKTVVAGGEAEGIYFWDPATGAIRRRFTSYTGILLVMAFSPDGKTLASSHRDRNSKVLLWDLDDK